MHFEICILRARKFQISYMLTDVVHILGCLQVGAKERKFFDVKVECQTEK